MRHWGLLHIHRRRDPLAIVDQRLAGKQARRVRVRPIPRCTTRNCGISPSELEESADLARRTLRPPPADSARRECDARARAGCAPAGSGILRPACNCCAHRWAERTLVHPEQMHPVPLNFAFRQLLEQQLRRGAAGNRERRELLPASASSSMAENVMRAGLGGSRAGRHRIWRLTLMTFSACASRAAGPASARKPGRGPGWTVPRAAKYSRRPRQDCAVGQRVDRTSAHCRSLAAHATLDRKPVTACR